MRLSLKRSADGLRAVIVIDRAGESETLVLAPSAGGLSTLQSGGDRQKRTNCFKKRYWPSFMRRSEIRT